MKLILVKFHWCNLRGWTQSAGHGLFLFVQGQFRSKHDPFSGPSLPKILPKYAVEQGTPKQGHYYQLVEPFFHMKNTASVANLESNQRCATQDTFHIQFSQN